MRRLCEGYATDRMGQSYIAIHFNLQLRMKYILRTAPGKRPVLLDTQLAENCRVRCRSITLSMLSICP